MNLQKKIKFSFFLIILFIFFIETFLRILKIEYPIFQKYDRERGFSLLPNSKGVWRVEGGGKIKINSDGLRDKEHNLKKPENTIRIAILGDSFAEARSVNLKDTFWFKLKKNLKTCENFHRKKKIEIINFGVSDYGNAQQFITLKNKVWKYNPDLVLLAFYSGNDVSDNTKALSGKKYRPYFVFKNDTLTVDKSYLNSKAYKILSSVPGQIFIKLSQYSRSLQLLREAYVKSYFLKKKNEIQTFKKTEINESNVYNPKNILWSQAWVTTEKIIKMIKEEVYKKKKEFILVSLSTPIQVNPIKENLNKFKNEKKIDNIFYPEERLKNFTKINSINYIELAKKMQSIAIKEKIYFHGFSNINLGSGHWNPQGHDVASKIISKGICKLY